MNQHDRILRLREVLDRSGLSQPTIYRRMKLGTFPPTVALGVNSVGWYESEFEIWFADPLGYRVADKAA